MLGKPEKIVLSFQRKDKQDRPIRLLLSREFRGRLGAKKTEKEEGKKGGLLGILIDKWEKAEGKMRMPFLKKGIRSLWNEIELYAVC